MHRLRRILLLSLMLACAAKYAAAQAPAWQDSLNMQLRLLNDLAQAGNYEQAQVESENFRAFLQRRKVFCPARAVPLISGIYFNNKDEKSASMFLAQAELDARRDRNPDGKAALLSAVAAEYERWKDPERALAAHKVLAVVQDSLSDRRLRAETFRLRQQIDSLENLRVLENTVENTFVRIERNRLLLIGGILALLFLAMLTANARSNERWRKKMANRELEMEIQIANLRHPDPIPAAENQTAVTPAFQRPFSNSAEPQQIALLIEPNRQIVLYLKSLLSDRFQIETASNPTEALHLANSLLPDLIVCDVVLNGKTGIDIARQIKLSERTNHIPIILLSDRFGNEGKLDALRAGAEMWFNRPVLDDEFDASVRRLLEGRKDKHDQFARFLHLYFTDSRIPADNPFLTHTVSFIEQHLADPDFMAEDLARKMQLPNHLFVKKLRALTGKEPPQLIRELRLEKARNLLEKRAGTPQAIAELVGFSNPGTFALAFKEYFGENTLLLHMPPRRLN